MCGCFLSLLGQGLGAVISSVLTEYNRYVALSSTYTAHAQHMHSTYTAHAQHMYSTCTAHAQHMHSTYTAHAQHMYSTCTAHVQCMYKHLCTCPCLVSVCDCRKYTPPAEQPVGLFGHFTSFVSADLLSRQDKVCSTTALRTLHFALCLLPPSTPYIIVLPFHLLSPLLGQQHAGSFGGLSHGCED